MKGLDSSMGQGIYLGDSLIQDIPGKVEGEYARLLDESFYRIRNFDRMPPFFMSIVSASDHWMFISSTGGLSAGRTSAESAVFPYYTDDRLEENAGNTGAVAVLRVTRGGKTCLWKPFSLGCEDVYRVER